MKKYSIFSLASKNWSILNNSDKHTYAVKMSKQSYFKQFISTQFSSIWPIDRNQSGASIPCQSGSGGDVNEEIPHIPQSSIITGTSPSECFGSCPAYSLARVGSYPSAKKQSVDCAIGHSWGESYLSEEKQSVYSTALSNWEKSYVIQKATYSNDNERLVSLHK